LAYLSRANEVIVMDFGLLPPEVNSGLMYAGPGSGPMLAAAAGWVEVAAELEAAAAGYGAQIGELTGVWMGPSSLAMSGAANSYVEWLQASSVAAAQTAAQAYGAAAAYDVAFAMTVPPPAITANRVQLAVLIATNFFGQNTAAIAATEAEYAQMWAQDATAMYSYAMEAKVVSTLQSFDDAPQTTNPQGQADQATAVARATVEQAVSNAAASVPDGSTVNVAPSGTTLDVGVTVTANPGYPVSAYGEVVIQSTTQMTFHELGGETITYPAGIHVSFDTVYIVDSGTFIIEDMTGSATVSSGGITAVGDGVSATFSGGVATAINAGTVMTGPASLTPFVPAAPIAPLAPSSSGLVGAAPAAAISSAPGLAGTAGIQPQLNVEALTEWAQGISGAEAAADLTAATS
jgi:PPE-repeat protein